jgi:hypothetical protein
MWSFFISLLLNVAVSYLSRVNPKDSIPPSEDEIDFPTSDQTRKIPYFAGTVNIEGANIIWANDFGFTRITEKVKTSIISSKRVTKGYRIKYGVAYALGWGDANTYLRKIKIGDKTAFFSATNNVTNNEPAGTYRIADPYLFTDLDRKEINGVLGDFDFYDGVTNQLKNEYMGSIDQTDSPAFKDLSYIVFNDFEWGTNITTLPPCQFELERFPQALAPAFCDISGSANPAEILYEILIDTEKFGLAVDPLDINTDNFIEVAETLFNEDLGMDIIFNSETTADEIKKDIEKHINASIYVDLYTGKWTIKLIREDYIKSELPFFNESNIISYSNYSKQQISNLTNEVKVIYKDRFDGFSKKTATAKNNSIAKLKNSFDSVSINYLAFSNSSTAQRVAQRDLNSLSNSKITLKLKVNRDAFGLNIGDAINVSMNNINVDQIVFRIREIDLGKYDDNKIGLDLIQDVFLYGNAIQDIPAETLWNRIEAVDYEYDFLHMNSPNFLSNQSFFDYRKDSILSVVSSYNSLSTSFKTKTSRIFIFGSPSPYELIDESEATTPFSELQISAKHYDSELIIKDSITNKNTQLNELEYYDDIDRIKGENLAYIENGVDGQFGEFISFSRATFDEIEGCWVLEDVWRGLLDTVPIEHNTNKKIWFLSYGFTDTTPQINILTVRTFDFFLQGSYLTNEDFEIDFFEYSPKNSDARCRLPLAVANLKINSQYYPDDIGQNDLVLSWLHRDKDNIAQVYKFDEITTANATDTYEIKIYDNSNQSLLKTETTTSTSYIFSDELTINTAGIYYSSLRVEIRTIDNSNISYTYHDVIVNRLT